LNPFVEVKAEEAHDDKEEEEPKKEGEGMQLILIHSIDIKTNICRRRGRRRK